MRLVFNERKAAQAAAFLLRLHGGSMNYMALIKLLYLADRQALVETGLPITGDKMVSMPHGPVLSLIYDRINLGNPHDSTAWFEYITEPTHYEVELAKQGEETDELSRYEMNVLQLIYNQYGSLDKWLLRDVTHTLPEWEDPHGSSMPIDPADILRAAGKSPKEIERIVADAEELCFFNSLDRPTK
ncbi:MAG: SocA family protein [Candidatus Tectomicrobia bacterium]|nr:SocA family protein [Candidatus Tectomicrobia bacterium]